jgi:hypothetical protein
MPRGVRKRICQERRATPRRLIAMPLKGKVEAPMETPFRLRDTILITPPNVRSGGASCFHRC